MPRNKKTDIKVTLLTYTDIRWLKAEFLRDEEDRARKKSTNKTLVVDVEALKSGAIELGIEVGITSLSPTLHSSPSLIPSIKA